MVEDAKVGSGISSTIRSAENSSISVDMAENAEVGEGDVSDNKMVKKSPLFKKLSELTGYFIFYAPEKDEFTLIVLAIVEALS